YDPQHDKWTPLATTGAPDAVDTLFWTGSKVLSTPTGRWCGHFRCPPPPTEPGHQLDLDTNAWRPIAPGPLDQNGADVWTGAALVGVGGAAAAAWDAAGDRWVALPAPPQTFVAFDAFWTGHEIVNWGEFVDSPGPAQTIRLGGLVFVPARLPDAHEALD